MTKPPKGPHYEVDSHVGTFYVPAPLIGKKPHGVFPNTLLVGGETFYDLARRLRPHVPFGRVALITYRKS